MFRFLVVLSLSLYVFANTEIINFHVSESHNKEFLFTNNWPRLNHSHNECEWTVLPAPFGTPLQEVCNSDTVDYPCPYELWLVLDLTRVWSTYSSFTLRLSWPASYPADFSLEIFNSESLSAHFERRLDLDLDLDSGSLTTHQTRLRYARIRLVDIGVLTPSPTTSQIVSPKPTPIPFILYLEPLYLGILPPSVMPILAYILVVSIVACVIVPPLIRHLEKIASQAKKELSSDANYKHD
ncbi:hypothetical protein E4T56_gene20148 [Termitomyces sp. T112]|nr:hypothetical protein E4T56_gene20148 [Termitomyces sp. T112]KAH0591292.1 hypothetical protein H2248_001380 [Termitomyces sp. 'cryptogamus']